MAKKVNKPRKSRADGCAFESQKPSDSQNPSRPPKASNPPKPSNASNAKPTARDRRKLMADNRIRAAAVDQPPPLFESLSEQMREEVLSKCDIQRYAKGECIIRAGERDDGLYVIARGRAQVTMVSSAGAETNLADLEQGELFGDTSFSSNRPHIITITALTAMHIIVMPPRVFDQMLELPPVATCAFMQQLFNAQHLMLKRIVDYVEKCKREKDEPEW